MNYIHKKACPEIKVKGICNQIKQKCPTIKAILNTLL